MGLWLVWGKSLAMLTADKPPPMILDEMLQSYLHLHLIKQIN